MTNILVENKENLRILFLNDCDIVYQPQEGV